MHNLNDAIEARLIKSCNLISHLVRDELRYSNRRTDDRELVDQRRILWARTAVIYGCTEPSDAHRHIGVNKAGSPIPSAEATRKLARAHGCELALLKTEPDSATVRGKAANDTEWSVVTFTRKDAERAGCFDRFIVLYGNQGYERDRWVECGFDLRTDALAWTDTQMTPMPEWAWLGSPERRGGYVKAEANEPYWRQTTAMLIARASTAIVRIIDPVQTSASTDDTFLAGDVDAADTLVLAR